jgi:hypothetical protein
MVKSQSKARVEARGQKDISTHARTVTAAKGVLKANALGRQGEEGKRSGDIRARARAMAKLALEQKVPVEQAKPKVDGGFGRPRWAKRPSDTQHDKKPQDKAIDLATEDQKATAAENTAPLKENDRTRAGNGQTKLPPKKPSVLAAYGKTKDQQKMCAESQKRQQAAAWRRRLVLRQREDELASFVNAVVGVATEPVPDVP